MLKLDSYELLIGSSLVEPHVVVVNPVGLFG